MGKLIVIEGLDSSGKETQSKLLCENLKSLGKPVRRIEFPNYAARSSELVKMYLEGAFGQKADDVNAYAASSFYAVDRYATYKCDFEDFYTSGGVVVADRYTTSNIIHQAGKIADPDEQTAYINWLLDYEYELLRLPRPDAVLFLDMPPEIGIRLMNGRRNKAGTQDKDIHERDTKYLFNTYENAKKMAKRLGWICIPCSADGEPRSIESIQQDVMCAVGELI